jgi:hypothetical protein
MAYALTNMKKVSSPCLWLSLLLLSSARNSMEQIPGESQLDRPVSFVGSALTCSQTQTIRVPRAVSERAKLKIQLMKLLRESLYDDSNGIVNIAREKEIKKLASKLNQY